MYELYDYNSETTFAKDCDKVQVMNALKDYVCKEIDAGRYPQCFIIKAGSKTKSISLGTNVWEYLE